MEKILPTDGSCPHCGKKFSDYNAESCDYGTPVRKCSSCGGAYLDRRYHEMAVDGYPQSGFDCKVSIKTMLFGLVFLLIALAYTAYTMHFRGYYSVKIVCTAVLAAVVMVVGIIDLISIKTGIKMKRFEKKMAESEKRLENPEYAQILAELGYSVPEKYLSYDYTYSKKA